MKSLHGLAPVLGAVPHMTVFFLRPSSPVSLQYTRVFSSTRGVWLEPYFQPCSSDDFRSVFKLQGGAAWAPPELMFSSSQCLVTCGKGHKHRQTWCQFGEDRLNDRFCDPETKPESVQTCQQQECAAWQVGPWGQVPPQRIYPSDNCVNGFAHTNVHTLRSLGGSSNNTCPSC